MKITSFCIVLLALVIGCGGKGGGMKVLPSAKEPPKVPASKATPIDPALREAAKSELLGALASNSAVIRVHAIEALKQELPEEKEPVIAALSDPALAVRFAAVMAVGELKLAEAKPALHRMADDRDGRLRAAVRYALHRLNDYSRTKELEKLSQDPLPQVRGTTALVLGMIGEKSALNVLRPMQRDREASVRLQVAEAMWRLEDVAGRDALIGYAISRFPDEQMVATLALGAPRDARIRPHVRANLTSEYQEVALVAARVMGQLGSDDGYGVAMKGLASSDPRQRSLAALALGAIARPDAQEMLAKLLKDGNEDVRLSAALGILLLKQ